jgi:hypothetical protein
MAPKTVYILFPTGGGGNNLGNILSLTPGFKPRFKPEKDYKTELLRKYQSTNKEISSAINPQWESTSVHFHLEDVDYVKNHPGIGIVCNHVNLFKDLAIYGKDWELTESDIIILFTYPEPDSFMYKRITESVWFGRHDPPENYNLEKFNQLTNVTVRQLDITRYASTDGFEYVSEFFKEHFDIILPKSGKELHNLWWSNISTKLHGNPKKKEVDPVPESVVHEVKFKVHQVLDIYRP